jgi:DNA-binding transcriptional regulator YdaS (Cro superfamily)
MWAMDSASALARYLKKQSLTDGEFARLIGVDASTVYRWRKGDRRPERDLVFVIERATRGAVSASGWKNKPKRAARKAPARVAARSTLNDKHSPQTS